MIEGVHYSSDSEQEEGEISVVKIKVINKNKAKLINQSTDITIGSNITNNQGVINIKQIICDQETSSNLNKSEKCDATNVKYPRSRYSRLQNLILLVCVILLAVTFLLGTLYLIYFAGERNQDVRLRRLSSLCHPSKISNRKFVSSCSNNRTRDYVKCTELSEPGTIAVLKCSPGFENPKPEQETTCGEDGRWFPPPTPCTRSCGKVIQQKMDISADTNISQMPWSVVIYLISSPNLEPKIKCGGTILNARTVITSRSCTWNAFNESIQRSFFRVKVGKSFTKYGKDKLRSQTFSVDKIHCKGSSEGVYGNFHDDIAIFVLNKNIEFNTFIAPICVDYNLSNKQKMLPRGWKGLIAGYDDKSFGESNGRLRKVPISVKGHNECKQKLPTFDLLVNKNTFCGEISSEAGDFLYKGSGLVFSQNDNNNGSDTKYYLRGIGLTTIVGNHKIQGSSGNVYFEHNLAFTNTANYTEFISFYDKLYEPVETVVTNGSNLLAPEFCNFDIPKYGNVYRISDTSVLTGIEDISNNESIQYECNENYVLVGETTNTCINGAWTNVGSICNFAPVIEDKVIEKKNNVIRLGDLDFSNIRSLDLPYDR